MRMHVTIVSLLACQVTTAHMESRGNHEGETIGWSYEPCGVGCCTSTSLDWPCISYTRGRKVHGWIEIGGTVEKSENEVGRTYHSLFLYGTWPYITYPCTGTYNSNGHIRGEGGWCWWLYYAILEFAFLTSTRHGDAGPLRQCGRWHS